MFLMIGGWYSLIWTIEAVPNLSSMKILESNMRNDHVLSSLRGVFHILVILH